MTIREGLLKFPHPTHPVLSSGLEGREDSFETSAVGPAKVVLTARSSFSATDYFSRGGRWPGVSGSGMLQFAL